MILNLCRVVFCGFLLSLGQRCSSRGLFIQKFSVWPGSCCYSRGPAACQSHALFFVHIIVCRQMNGSLRQGPALNEVSRRRPEVLCQQLCGWSLIRVMGVAGVGSSSQKTGLESTLDRPSAPHRPHAVLSLRQGGVA